jgi:hypothetical protein
MNLDYMVEKGVGPVTANLAGYSVVRNSSGHLILLGRERLG